MFYSQIGGCFCEYWRRLFSLPDLSQLGKINICFRFSPILYSRRLILRFTLQHSENDAMHPADILHTLLSESARGSNHSGDLFLHGKEYLLLFV